MTSVWATPGFSFFVSLFTVLLSLDFASASSAPFFLASEACRVLRMSNAPCVSFSEIAVSSLPFSPVHCGIVSSTALMAVERVAHSQAKVELGVVAPASLPRAGGENEIAHRSSVAIAGRVV